MKRIASAVVAPTGPNYTQAVETAGFALLLASLGSCTAITLRMYADRKGWNIGALKVSLTLSLDAEGRTLIERTLDSNARLDGEQRLKLLDIASKTPVTKTLLAGASITTRRAEVA
ncbi:MAG: OsmC family protein [Steroidobacteraceae bacterium]